MGDRQYVLDNKASQLTLQVFAEGLAGIADHRPRFYVREFCGVVEFKPGAQEGNSLHLTARAGSLEVMDEVKDDDRRAIERVMFGEVLHPELFPEIAFRSSKVVCASVAESRYRADITGTMSLHGVENSQVIPTQLILSDGSMRAYGEFWLRQGDYGLSIASVAGGMLRIKDEVKFVFFLVGRK